MEMTTEEIQEYGSGFSAGVKHMLDGGNQNDAPVEDDESMYYQGFLDGMESMEEMME